MVSTTQELADFCRRIRDEKLIMLDTEFIREESYFPRLETIQLRAGDEIEIIDYPPIKNFDPLWEILYDPDVRIVMHAGQQDLALLYQATQRPLTNVFDTQIAAAFVGYGEQIGYGQLVRQITGVNLSKSQSFTAWGMRPLTDAQIEYAMDDVRHLPPVYEHLLERLQSLDRLEWAQEEFEKLEQSATAEPTPMNELYLRVRGADNLEPRELAVLRELTAWREEEAQYKNKLPQRLLRDDILVNLARRQPESLGDLRRLRGFPPNEVDRQGAGILAAIKKGREVPKESWPEKPRPRYTDPNTQAIAWFLQSFVRARALDSEIAWNLLASSSELEEIIGKREEIKAGDTPMLTGWRHQLIGEDLLKLIKGELALRFDPQKARVHAEA